MKERKTFTFDGENSADYGLYISGDSVYNAPNREIDMVSIPGRNGQLAIDMGRYENITVTYPAFVFADTQEEFREKIRRIRNWLCSKTSYQRLTDEYNPESFRLGLYKSGLEVEPIFYNRCGEFEMSFDCKPQRFLFTGEEVFTLGEWGETETYSGSIVSFEGTETTAIKTLNANIVPKQSGSGDPSPSNVRPISGYEGVNVTRCGKNLLDPAYRTTYSTNTINYYKNADGLLLKANTTYVFSVSDRNGEMAIKKERSNTTIKNIYSNTVLTYTPTEDVRVWFDIYFSSSLPAPSGGLSTVTCQVEVGTEATEYEPYNSASTSYPISLGQTVYGGTLEVMSGKLTIRQKGVDMGSVNWGYNGTPSSGVYQYVYNFTDKANGRLNFITESFNVTNTSVAVGTCVGRDGNGAISFNSAETTAEAFKTSVNGQKIVYELATPIEVTLTPTQVKTLLGNNNIFADSGDVTVEIGENPYILVNPTKFEATPIFEVEGSGTLSVGDTTLTINNDGTTIIDTEMMEAYEDDNGAIISRNDDVEGGFPTLTSGINNVEADGLTSVKVTPKWWEL